MEQWKAIKDYENLYEVSSLGNVRSVDRYVKTKNGSRFIRGKEMAKIEDKDGYLKVCLCKNSVKKSYMIHRLVANAFLDNPFNYPSINHIDENKKNNSTENLEFCTVKYNNNFNGGQYRRAEKRKKPIKQLLNGIVVAVWDSSSTASRELHISKCNIVGCLNGYRKTAGGYGWKYE